MRTVYVYKWVDNKCYYKGTVDIPNSNFIDQLNTIRKAFGEDCIWYNHPILSLNALSK
jgi:hypothetical protein